MSNAKIINSFITKVSKVVAIDDEIENSLRQVLTDTLNEFSINIDMEKKPEKKVLKLKPTVADSLVEKITYSNFPLENLLKETVANLKNMAKNYGLTITSKEKKNEIIAKLKNISVSEIDAFVEEEKMKKEKKVVKKTSEIVPDVITKYKQGRVNTIKSPFDNYLYPNTNFVIGKTAKITGKEDANGKIVKLTPEDIEYIKEHCKVNIDLDAIIEDLSIDQTIDVQAIQNEDEDLTKNVEEEESPVKKALLFQEDEDLEEEE